VTGVQTCALPISAKYGVRGYPTVFLLDAKGEQLGRTGYQAGGGAAYVKHLKELLEAKGVKTEEKAEAGKALTAYEKMKAEKAEKAAAQAGDKK
jgi:thioredoxin-related protein